MYNLLVAYQGYAFNGLVHNYSHTNSLDVGAQPRVCLYTIRLYLTYSHCINLICHTVKLNYTILSLIRLIYREALPSNISQPSDSTSFHCIVPSLYFIIHHNIAFLSPSTPSIVSTRSRPKSHTYIQSRTMDQIPQPDPDLLPSKSLIEPVEAHRAFLDDYPNIDANHKNITVALISQ